MSEHIRSSDVVQHLVDAGSAQPAEPPSAGPALKPFRPFPVDALPTCVARFTYAVAKATGTDPSWAALAALVILAGCVGNRVAIILKRGWVEPAILWAALVGKSGSTKSVVLRLLTRPLIELFTLERNSFAEQMKEYQVAMARYGVELTEWKLAQKKGPPTDPPLEPEMPKERRVLVSDITVEKLAVLLGENPLGLLVSRDELAGFVNSFDRYAGGKGSDLQSWLSMNDGGSLLVDRKTASSTFVERASVSVLGTIQPHTLESVFGITEREAGLLARLLLAYPPHRPALWTEEELPDDLVVEWRDLLAGLLSLEPARDDAGQPKPRLIGLSGDAKKLFIAWHDQHAIEVADLGNDHLRAHWAKLKGICARIALLFACVEAARGMSVASVSADCMARAIQITEWLKQESARIYSGLGDTNENRARRKLVDWIEGRGRKVTVRDLTHNLQEFRGKTDAARAALDALVKSEIGNWVIPPPGVAGGRPTEWFELARPSANTTTNTPPNAPENDGFGGGVDESGAK